MYKMMIFLLTTSFIHSAHSANKNIIYVVNCNDGSYYASGSKVNAQFFMETQLEKDEGMKCGLSETTRRKFFKGI